MNEHAVLKDLLPLYVADQLSQEERESVEKHLPNCAACRADLELWQMVGGAIHTQSSSVVAPPDLAERALAQIHARPSRITDFAFVVTTFSRYGAAEKALKRSLRTLAVALARAWALLRAQAMLVHHELWSACAALMAIGVVVALLAEKASVIHFLAPLVSAAGLAVLYGPEHDPVTELALATPTSSWKILLARLALVSGYNLVLALAASFALLALIPADLLGSLIVGWLGPMAFLSTLALLLSLWIGTGNAVTLVYGLWLARYFLPALALDGQRLPPIWFDFLSAYQQFWQSPVLLLTLSIALLGAVLLSIARSERLLPRRFA